MFLHERLRRLTPAPVPAICGPVQPGLPPAKLSDLQSALVELHPALAKMLPTMLILVDGVSVTGNPELNDNSEVDIMVIAVGG